MRDESYREVYGFFKGCWDSGMVPSGVGLASWLFSRGYGDGFVVGMGILRRFSGRLVAPHVVGGELFIERGLRYGSDLVEIS